MNEFEEIIKNDDSLSTLLNERTITAFSNFSRKRHSDAFKEYIEERYLTVFMEIYERVRESRNVSQTTALIRSVNYLATERSKNQIIPKLLPILETAHEKLVIFKDSLEEDGESVTITAKLDQPVDAVAIKIFNEFDNDDRIEGHKQKIIATALEICDIVGNVNPKRHPFRYAVHNAVMNNLKEIDSYGSMTEKYQEHDQIITKKRTNVDIKYVVLGVVVIILLLLKILSRLG